jgi:hypothetical protein
MKKSQLNRTATKTFLRLVEGLGQEQHYRKIDNAPGSFMAVYVNFLYRAGDLGTVYSVAHNRIINCDLVSDPDMEFLVQGEAVYPMTFELGALGVYDVGMRILRGKLVGIPKTQHDLTRFANVWLRNIQLQQSL